MNNKIIELENNYKLISIEFKTFKDKIEKLTNENINLKFRIIELEKIIDNKK